MKLQQLEISSAEKWKGCNDDNNLFILYNKSTGHELTKLKNIIIEVNKVNINGIISDGKKYGFYIKDIKNTTFKLWWNRHESAHLNINIVINDVYSTRVILERDGFKVSGINKNGPHNTEKWALKSPDGTLYHYDNGKKHNANGPAVIYLSGKEEWYLHGNRLNDKEIETYKLKLLGFDDIEIEILDLLDLK